MNDVFLETIRCEDGKALHLHYHQLRYESVLHSLGSQEYKNLANLIKPPRQGVYRCRVSYTTQEISIEYLPYEKRKVSRLKLLHADTIKYSKKYKNREEINQLFEKKAEADDILIVQNKKITDTSIANIAFFDGKRWYTPKEPLLKGTTRARLLDEGKIFEKDIFEKDIYCFQRVALLNAMIDFDIIAKENIRDIYC